MPDLDETQLAEMLVDVVTKGILQKLQEGAASAGELEESLSEQNVIALNVGGRSRLSRGLEALCQAGTVKRGADGDGAFFYLPDAMMIQWDAQ